MTSYRCGLIPAAWALLVLVACADSSPTTPDAATISADAVLALDANSTFDAGIPDAMVELDAQTECIPACATAQVTYPDDAPTQGSVPTFCSDAVCGVPTLDNRSGLPSEFTRVSCHDICAMATYSGSPMVCAPRCTGGLTESGTIYSYGGGNVGGFGYYDATGLEPLLMEFSCDEVPFAVVGSTELRAFENQTCCCQAGG